jgi:hypothetical protein
MDCLHRTVRIVNGSGGRTRTATGFTPTDFESVVSTNFTTPPSESAGDYTKVESESNNKCRTSLFRQAFYKRSNNDSWETWANDCCAACSTKLWKLKLLIASA